jgi:hypothetical protein
MMLQTTITGKAALKSDVLLSLEKCARTRTQSGERNEHVAVGE